jgi:hydroxyacylglutathione hydrolase
MGSYPSYFIFIADINRREPDVLGGVTQAASLKPLFVRQQMN